MKHTHTSLTVIAVAAFMAFCLAGCGTPVQASTPGSASDAPAQAYSLRVGQTGTSIKASMVILAYELGYYEEEGVNVTLEQISSLNDGLTAITTGKLDILPMGVIPTCTFISQGSELTIFGGTIAEGSVCISLPEREEEFRTLENFSGKTVACVRAETGHMLMKSAMRQAGVELEQMDFVELDGFQSVVEAVMKGTADVGFVNSGFEQNAYAQGLASPFYVAEYFPDAVCCRQTASRAALEENREAYVRFQIANLRAMKTMYDDPKLTLSTLSAYSGQTEDYVEYCIYDSAMKISMDPARERVQEFYQIMKDNGDLDPNTPYDMSDAVDTTIYYDALMEVIDRYPDDPHFQAVLVQYEENNGL